MERKLYEQNRLDTTGQACLIEPQNLAGGVTNSIWLGVQHYDKFMFVIMGGNCANIGDTLDAHVEQATTTGGAGAKVVAGKAITQVVSTATDQDDIWYIHLYIDELDVDAYYDSVRLVLEVSANDTWYIAAFCLREQRVFEISPVTSVTEIIG